jgi:hypothetical protein
MHPITFINLAIPEILRAFEKIVAADQLDTIIDAKDAKEVMGQFTIFKRTLDDTSSPKGDIVFAVKNIDNKPNNICNNRLFQGDICWLYNGLPVFLIGDNSSFSELEHKHKKQKLLFYHAYIGGLPNDITLEGQAPKLELHERMSLGNFAPVKLKPTITHNPFIHEIYISTPNGGDYTSCPLCDMFLRNWKDKHNDGVITHDDNMHEEDANVIGLFTNSSDPNEDIFYCLNCDILFRDTHTYACNGCTDDISNSDMVYRYIFDGVEYTNKFPSFQSFACFKTLVESKRLHILEMKCTCNGIKSSREASYPMEEYPEFYKTDCGSDITSIIVDKVEIDRWD